MHRRDRTGRQKIRFVAPAILGAAIYLAAVPSSLADTRPPGALLPLLKPSTTLTSVASTAIVSGSASESSFVLPTLRPVAATAPSTSSKGTAKSAPATSAANDLRYNTVIVKQGDSLLATLVRGGVSAADAHRNLSKISAQIDARKLQPGDKLTLGFVSDTKGRHLALLRWNGKRGHSASVALLPRALQSAPAAEVASTSAPTADPKNAAAPKDAAAGMVQKTLAVRGSPSLPRVLSGLGLPAEVSEQLMMTLSQSRKPPVHGELLTIAYFVPNEGTAGATPRLNYAAYKGKDGKQHVLRFAAYASPTALQHVDVMPAAMVALWDPLPGAKISSPFGWRIHPVFHTRLFHKGCDYEARAGTPVMAAADGLVEDVGRRGNYGNYILIRHSGRLETAYAHLAGFAPTVAAGTMVRRGEVIGYVGMTGVATGPHLYYEIIVDGRQIDPEGAALKQATKAYLTQTATIN
jgi:murein DD-endopeptidase MepM/ murein hydrolase activator NlpD